MTRVLFAALMLFAVIQPAQAADIDDRAAASRAVVKQFFGSLKGELVSAMKAGGPVNAIGVCNEKAPAIASSISAEKGWRVARTSLKMRNINNAPDTWEQAVLQSFDARKDAGEDPMKIEHFEVVEQNGKKMFRYMKAIPTAPKPCLACHGKNINPKITAKLDRLYPGDSARGYRAGEIRGAFTISQPMD